MRALIPKLVLLGFSLSLAIGMGEVFVRLVVPVDLGIWRTTRDGLITLRPGIDTRLPSFGQDVRTNDLGFRDEPRTRTKPKDVFRVVVVGDSFMEALQVAHSDSLPHLLEKLLGEHSSRSIEVLNAGVSGWGTDDQLTWLRREGFGLEPDLVLIARTLHNDVSDNVELRHHELIDGVPHPRPRVEMPVLEYADLEIKGWLAGHSYLYRFLTNALHGRELKARADGLNRHVDELIRRQPSEEIEHGWQWTDMYLDAIVHEGRAIGVQTAVFLIPLAVQLSDSAFDEFVARRALGLDEVDPEKPQSRMANWGREADVDVIDLLEAFRDRTASSPGILYLPSDGHWNAAGHELAAGVVAERLLRRGLVPVNPALPTDNYD